ncbi:MAG TPA: hypothetical protein VGN32_20505 [Ktedonobacterales bacterium]|nr:hypothetical protein [Ktedonobacterales bacterium]
MIQLGVLWFDDDPKRPLAQKVEQAVVRYRERLGRAPDLCQLNPAQAAALATQKAAGLPALRLVADASVRPNYFLVGSEDELVATEPSWAAALAEGQEPAGVVSGGATARIRSSKQRKRTAAPQSIPPSTPAAVSGSTPNATPRSHRVAATVTAPAPRRKPAPSAPTPAPRANPAPTPSAKPVRASARKQTGGRALTVTTAVSVPALAPPVAEVAHAQARRSRRQAVRGSAPVIVAPSSGALRVVQAQLPLDTDLAPDSRQRRARQNQGGTDVLAPGIAVSTTTRTRGHRLKDADQPGDNDKRPGQTSTRHHRRAS